MKIVFNSVKKNLEFLSYLQDHIINTENHHYRSNMNAAYFKSRSEIFLGRVLWKKKKIRIHQDPRTKKKQFLVNFGIVILND